jgi:hypothetical protein
VSDERRCGWQITRSDGYNDPTRIDLIRIDLIRISDGEIRFYLPQEMYSDLDDEAFLALCKAKRETREAPSRSGSLEAC